MSVENISEIVKADRKKFEFAVDSPLVLLDVDGTLIGRTSEPNQALINALKEQNIKKVVLFSSCHASQIPNQAFDQSTRTHAINILKQAGIEVLCTIITASPYFEEDSSLGDYYKNDYSPVEEKAVQLNNVEAERDEASEKLANDKNFIALKETENDMLEKKLLKVPASKYEGGKEEMLKHLLHHIPDGSRILAFDDSEKVINDFNTIAKEAEVLNRNIIIEVAAVNMTDRSVLDSLTEKIIKHETYEVKNSPGKVNEDLLKDSSLKEEIQKTIRKNISKLLTWRNDKKLQEETYIGQQNENQKTYASKIETFKSKIPAQQALLNIFKSDQKSELDELGLEKEISNYRSLEEKLRFIEFVFDQLPHNKKPLDDKVIKTIAVLKNAYLKALIKEVEKTGGEANLEFAKKSPLVNFWNSNLDLSALGAKTGTYKAINNIIDNRKYIKDYKDADKNISALAQMQLNMNPNSRVMTIIDSGGDYQQLKTEIKRADENLKNLNKTDPENLALIIEAITEINDISTKIYRFLLQEKISEKQKDTLISLVTNILEKQQKNTTPKKDSKEIKNKSSKNDSQSVKNAQKISDSQGNTGVNPLTNPINNSINHRMK